MGADVKAALSALNDRVLGRKGVQGTAVGERGGAPCLVVYVSDEAACADVPGQVKGVPVRTEVSGGFRRF